MADALIIDAIRSAVGRRNGTLAAVRADDLAADVLNGLVDRVGIDTAEIEDVQMGCVTQVGEQAVNSGRIAALGDAGQRSGRGHRVVNDLRVGLHEQPGGSQAEVHDEGGGGTVTMFVHVWGPW